MADRRAVLWAHVAALAGLQGAIACAWVTYKLYLPELLAAVGLTGWGPSVLLLEAGLAIALEPMAGYWSDRQWSKLERRFSLVAIAVMGAAGLLLLLPAIAFFGPVVAVLLLAVLLLWAVAMAAFRGPAIAMLRQYAIASQLPQAMGALIFATAFVGAIAPPLQGWIANLGAPVALGGSSLLLVAAALLMAAVRPEATLDPAARLATPLPPLSHREGRAMATIAALGASVGLGLRGIFGSLGAAGTAWFATGGSLVPFGAGLTVAFLAVPAGRLASEFGLARSLYLCGALLTIAVPAIGAIAVPHLSLALAIVAVMRWTVEFNGTIPLALGSVPVGRSGLAIGSYFRGFALASLIAGLSPGLTAGLLGIPFAAIAVLSWSLRPQSARAAVPKS